MQPSWGPYAVVAEIGQGGGGFVLRGRGPRGEDVAIKVLKSGNPEALARFRREARLQAGLGEKEGFVPLLDGGDAPSPFLVMPFLAGGTLRDRLHRGPLSIEETVALGRKLAAAIGRAHALGIVHRDLKPENVLFTAKGEPLVADLGIAKHFRRDGVDGVASQSLSKTGMLRGTAGYMPAEQLRDSKEVKPPADVFALGAILYECLAGVPTFSARDVLALIAQVETGDHPPLARWRPDVPRWLAGVIERALARDPARRHANAGELLAALERGEGAPSRAVPIAVFLVAAVAGAGALAIGLLHPVPPPPAVAPPRPSVQPARTVFVPELYRGLETEGRLRLAHVLGRPDGKQAERIFAVAFSRDGRAVVAGGAMNAVESTEVATGVVRGRGRGHASWIRSLACGERGLIFSGSEDGTARLWDLARQEAPLATFTGHQGPVWSVALSSDGELALTAGKDGTARLWNLARAAEVGRLDHAKEATSVAFSPDGRRAFSGSLDGTVVMLDLSTFAKRTIELVRGPIRALAATDARLLLGHADGSLTLVDLTGRELWHAETHQGEARSVAFSPDGKSVVSGGDDGMAVLRETASGAALGTLAGHTSSIESVAFSPDGKLVATASQDQSVRFWDPVERREKTPARLGSRSRITAIAISADKKRVATAGWDRVLRLWDMEKEEEVAALEGHAAGISALAFSRAGDRIASAGDDGAACTWDMAGARLRHVFEHPGRVRGLAFLPDGRLLTACDDGSTRLWDGETGGLLRTAAHPSLPLALAVSGDGKEAAVGGQDGAVRLMDVATGEILETWKGHSKWVNGVAFGPDRTVFSAGEDHLLEVWDLESRNGLGHFEGPAPEWAVTPLGPRAVVVSGGVGNVHVIDLSSMTPTEHLELEKRAGDFALAITSSADGKLLLLGTSRGVVLAYDVK